MTVSVRPAQTPRSSTLGGGCSAASLENFGFHCKIFTVGVKPSFSLCLLLGLWLRFTFQMETRYQPDRHEVKILILSYSNAIALFLLLSPLLSLFLIIVLLIALLIALLNIFKASNFFFLYFRGKKGRASSRKKHTQKFNCFPNLATLQIKAN